MIPPPYGNFSCAGSGNPTCLSPYDKNCVINCVLPEVVPTLTTALGLAAPLDLLTFFGGPTHTNASAMPGLHPDCNGYSILGAYVASKVFEVFRSKSV